MRLLPLLSFRAGLVAALLLLGHGAALAASPVGTWTLDEEALHAAIQQKLEARLAKLPPASGLLQGRAGQCGVAVRWA